MRAMVFPTRVGVNPNESDLKMTAVRFPHPRGGEPRRDRNKGYDNIVFPTRVGVNRAIPT